MSKLNTYSRGWAECQPEEKARIEQQRQADMAKADDEIPRGGDPLSLLIAIVLGVAVTVIMITGIITLASSVRERITAPDTTHIVAS